MSVVTRVRKAGERVDWDALGTRLLTAVFGDRNGLALFLGSLCGLFVFARVGIFITDTFTTANAFVALTDGQLAVTEPFYGDSLDTPGTLSRDGMHFGRNYGQLVASLPAYWLLEGVSFVADLRVALVGAWSLALLGLSVLLGRITGYEREFFVGGGVLTLLSFGVNVALATPIADRMIPVLAMQLTSLVAGALLAVVVYRLVRLLTTPRVGVAAAVLVVFGTPVGFWAPIPKRHVLTALLTFVAFLAFARSRSPEEPRRLALHATAYGMAGLLAWVHAPEGFVLFVTLVVTDLVSSPLSRVRAVPVVAGVFVLSLLPLFLTNLFVTGNPVVPPRVESGLGIQTPAGDVFGTGGGGADSAEQAGNGSAEQAGNGSAEGGQDAPGLPLIETALSPLGAFLDQLRLGVETLIFSTDRTTRTFLRSGYVSDNSPAIGEAINLSMVESAPVVGALATLPTRAMAGRSGFGTIPRRLREPGGATAFAMALYAVVFSLLYLPLLPIHAQITVRYLLPVYAVAVVAVVWAGPGRRALQSHLRTFGWATAGSVLIGGQILLVIFVGLDLALGETFQLYALFGLALAGFVAGLSLLERVSERASINRLLAAILGVTTAAVVVFTLLVVTAFDSAIGVYPNDGGQLLPVVRLLAELLAPL